MVNRAGGRKLQTLFIFLAYSTVLFLWIEKISPFPDRDSVSQFYFPFLNYLRASQEIGNEFWFLKDLIPVEYPWGIMLIPALCALLGLQEILLNHPWLVNGFLVLALSLTASSISFPKKRYWIFVTALFFIPISQVALKNFNLHSFNVLFFLCGIAWFFAYLESGAKNFLYGALISFWLACIVKHLGILFFLLGWLSFLIWKVHKRQSIRKSLLVGFFILLVSIPFYPWAGFPGYLHGIMRHNPDLNSISALLIGISLILTIAFYWIYLARSSVSRKPIPRLFGNGITLVVFGISVLWIISLDSNFNPPLWMLISFLIGMVLVSLYLRNFDFSSVRGLKILFLILSLSISLPLYFSRLVQVSMLFFPGIYLALILFFEESEKELTPIFLTASFVVFSSFFPGLERLEQILGSHGFGIYARGMNTLHQNSLGWEKSSLPQLRRNMNQVLSELGYREDQNSLLLLHPHLHSHSALVLQFPEQFLYPFPPIQLLEQLPDSALEEFFDLLRHDQNGGFHKILENRSLPLILISKDSWSLYLKWDGDLGRLAQHYDRNELIHWLPLAYWRFLVENGLLSSHYESRILRGGDKPRMLLLLQKSAFEDSPAENLIHRRLVSYITSYREEYSPEIKVARIVFERASHFFDQDRMFEAGILLNIAARLDPDHEEIQKDLLIARESMNKQEKDRLKELGLGEAASKIQPGLEALLEWKEGPEGLPQEIIAFLKGEHVLKEHRDPPQQEPIDSFERNRKANDLFLESTRYFEKNPKKAIRLLKEALEHDPAHEEARKDLNILQKGFLNSEKEIESR